MKKKYTAMDIVEAENLYGSTGDPTFIVLAVGENPFQPPSWAVRAAIALRDKAAIRHEATRQPDKVGGVLNDVIRCFFAVRDRFVAASAENAELPISAYQVPSLRSMITAALKLDGVEVFHPIWETRFRQIYDAWVRECEGLEPDETDECGVPKTRRWHHMVMEWGDREGGAPKSQISRYLWAAR